MSSSISQSNPIIIMYLFIYKSEEQYLHSTGCGRED
ncbi:unnamed protein product [Acanthoscelides obtectus]|uniref:Uncharacterized protein n=1 Tax=Acanthoscelides obtectus TaxID=200917 RepID=A0A9P0P5B0_ACAOB|nr:unnamed protein product [Acanthoscelides obtectus]CAK1648342.1 hypothetical protein AOBTE_LOCUS15681 [Acanthoscelides obtectus]